MPWDVFVPGIVFPALTFAALYAWPWIEGWFMDDRDMHQLCIPPRQRPAHTAIGASFFSFYLMSLIASGDDVLAKFFTISLNDTVWAFRVAQFLLPAIIGIVTYFACRSLQRVPPRRHLRQPAAVELHADGTYHAVFDGPPLEEEEAAPIETPDAVVAPVAEGA